MSVLNTLTNKHVVVAMLVAPVLAVAAWYAAGWFSGVQPEEPAPAEAGQTYPLIEAPGCRYAGGTCVLKNEDFALRVRVSEQAVVMVDSVVPVDYLMVGLRSGGDAKPTLAKAVDDSRQRWALRISAMPETADALRFVAGVGGAAWFGEASLVFLTPSTQPAD